MSGREHVNEPTAVELSAAGGAEPADEMDSDPPAAVLRGGPPVAVGRPVRPWPAWRMRLRATLQLIRANPTGRIALKIAVAVVGGLIVAIGIVLIPLPGPGWGIVILGLAVWAIEFAWAKHLLRFTRTQISRWTWWIRRQSVAARLALGAAGMVFVSFMVWLSLKYSVGIDLVAGILHYLATH
ncbi:MAG TPA: TIGR02611 family protein [Micromonosporaceae bacterium]|nr:TIGR02611 family protein [Micromonosporaceae bacterium]